MKISFIIHELTYSGAPKMMSWIANSFSKSGHETEIISCYGDNCLQAINGNVNVVLLKEKRANSWLKRNFIDSFKITNKLFKHFKKSKPDIIINFLDNISYFFIFRNHFRINKQFIIISSERVDPSKYNKKSALLKKKILSWSDGIVFQTEGAKSYFGSKIANKSIVIPNPVIISNKDKDFLQCPISFSQREKIIVSVGRLFLKQKRQDVMIEAFTFFHRENPNYKLFIFGDGGDKKAIENIIEKAGMKDYIFLKGRTENVEKAIFDSSAFVFTSDYEGIPNSVIEALSVGVPVVATDCDPGGARLLIQDGVNGFLVPRGDSEAIADRLNKIVNNEILSNSFANEAIKISQTFSEENIFNMWRDYVEEVVNKC